MTPKNRGNKQGEILKACICGTTCCSRYREFFRDKFGPHNYIPIRYYGSHHYFETSITSRNKMRVRMLEQPSITGAKKIVQISLLYGIFHHLLVT